PYLKLQTFKLDNPDSPRKLRQRFATSLFTIQSSLTICNVKYGREAISKFMIVSTNQHKSFNVFCPHSYSSQETFQESHTYTIFGFILFQ
ncbi:hypothetical protein CR513_32150, partial [Mucuna pruriens]